MENLYERTKFQLRMPRLPTPDQLRILLPCLARFGCAFACTGASLRGGYLPFGLCVLTIPAPGMHGLSSLLGVCLGAFLLWPPLVAAEIAATAILIRTAVWAFQGTTVSSLPLFMPATAAIMAAVVSCFLLTLGALPADTIPFAVLRVLICFGGSWLLREISARPTREGFLLLIGCLTLSACAISPLGFSAGILLGAFFTVSSAGNSESLSVAAVCGVALDATLTSPVPMTAVLCTAALLSSWTQHDSRFLAAAAAALAILGGVLLSGWENAAVFWSALPGVALAGLLPGGAFRMPDATAQRPRLPVLHMQQASGLLEELGERLRGQLPTAEPVEPSRIFDRASDRVCRTCAQFSLCWRGSCNAYDALRDAAGPMLERGAALREDFSPDFLARCRRMDALLNAINQELDGVLYRRQFRHRLEESRRLLAEQHRIFAAYLQDKAEMLSSGGRKRIICTPLIGFAAAERRGNSICGDRGASFRTARHLHYILLCDGMGSGFEAMSESSECVRLLRELLVSGFRPEDALQLLNGIYLLRDDGSFSTVDLLETDLSSGAVTLWKWGSAPSYLKQGDTLKKIGTALPPPGLEGTGRAERFQLSLEAEDLLVLLSDGAVGPDTEEQIRACGGSSPAELASAIIARKGGEEDDRTAVVLKLQPVVSRRQHTTNCA